MRSYMLFKWNGTYFWVYCNDETEGLLRLKVMLENYQMTLDEYEIYKSNGYNDVIECFGFDIGLMLRNRSNFDPSITREKLMAN